MTVHVRPKTSCLPQAYPTRLTSKQTAMEHVCLEGAFYVLHRQTCSMTVREVGSTREYTLDRVT